MLDGGSDKRVDHISGMQGVGVVVTHWTSAPLHARCTSQLLSTSHLLTLPSFERSQNDLTRLSILASFQRAHPHPTPHGLSFISRQTRHAHQIVSILLKPPNRPHHHTGLSRLHSLQAIRTILDSEDPSVENAAHGANEAITCSQRRGLPVTATGAASASEEVSIGCRLNLLVVRSIGRGGASARRDAVASASLQQRQGPVSRLSQAVTSSDLHSFTSRASHLEPHNLKPHQPHSSSSLHITSVQRKAPYHASGIPRSNSPSYAPRQAHSPLWSDISQ